MTGFYAVAFATAVYAVSWLVGSLVITWGDR